MNTRSILLSGFIKRIVCSSTIRQRQAATYLYTNQKEYPDRTIYSGRRNGIDRQLWIKTIRNYNLLNERSTHRRGLEFENDYIYHHVYKRLENLQDYIEEMPSLPIDSDIKQLRNILRQKNIISKESFRKEVDNLMSSISERIKLMTQQELAALLTIIKADVQLEFLEIKVLIDLELRWLLKKNVKTYLMDIDLWFYLADTFYGCFMESNFVGVLVKYMAVEEDIALTNSQFIHLLFLVILQRKHDGILSKYEDRILQMLDKSSFEDISTISLAYFKTKTKITDPRIRHKIIERTIEQLPFIDPSKPGYCSVVKAIRYSRDTSSRGCVSDLLSALLKNRHIIETSHYNAVHTVKLLESYRIYEPQILDLFSKKMLSNMRHYRIKDIQYGLTSLSNFYYKELVDDRYSRNKLNELCDMIISEKIYLKDKQYYHLLPILRAFCILGYYNPRFLAYASNILQDPEKVDQMSDVLEFDRSALLVLEATRIEFGKHLEPIDLFKKISKRMDRNGMLGSVRQDSSIKHLDFVLRSYSETFSHLAISKAFFGLTKKLVSAEEFQDRDYKFNFQYTLPHTNFADLVISKGYKEPGSFDNETLLAKRVPEGQNHCLIMAIRPFDYVDGCQRLTGYKMIVTRLLSKLGYTVIHADLETPDIPALIQRIRACLDAEHKKGTISIEATIN